MVNIRLIYFLIGLCSLSANASTNKANFSEQSFSYRTLIPDDGTNCQASSEALALRFQKSTGRQVTSSNCQGSEAITDQGHSFQNNIVIVNYISTEEVLPYIALFSGRVFNNQPQGDAGVFASYAECLQALSKQKQVFEKNTHLALVAGHCSASTDLVLNGFYLSLEGFGQPAKQLYGYNDDQVTNVTYSDPAIQSLALKVIADSGAQVAWSDSLHVFYYNDEALDVASYNVGLFASEDLCLLQKKDAETIFTKGGLQSVSVLCAKYLDATSLSRELTVVGVGLGRWNQDFAMDSAKYVSLSECLSDKARFVQNHTSSGQNVLGALCKPDDRDTLSGQFVIEIYYAY